MKKILMLVVTSLFVYNIAQAQAIETGDQAINIGLGIGGPLGDSGNGFPSINGSYEILPLEKLGIGYIGFGGSVTYKYSGYENGNYKYGVNYLVVGGRGTYHFDFYEMTGDKIFNQLDLYAGVFAGVSYDNDFNHDDNEPYDTNYESSFRNDIFAGVRFNFNPNFGVYSEVGYGINNLSFGVDFLF